MRIPFLSVATLIAPLFLLAQLGGENPKNELHDLLGTSLDYQVNRLVAAAQAPLILAGRVMANRSVGPIKPSRRFPTVPVALREVDLEVEIVLRSHLTHKPVPSRTNIYYYSQEVAPGMEGNPFHKLLYEAVPGRRYVFFLLCERGLLRSIGDVGQYSIEIRSGRHSAEEINRHCGGSPSLSCQLPWLLLTPGEDMDARHFAAGLSQARVFADMVGSRKRTLGLLEKLPGSDLHVDAESCHELVRMYYGKWRCLERLRDDERQPASVRSYAATRMAVAIRLESELLGRLKSGVLSFPGLQNPDSLQAMKEEVEMLIDHPDPKVQSIAASLLLLEIWR